MKCTKKECVPVKGNKFVYCKNCKLLLAELTPQYIEKLRKEHDEIVKSIPDFFYRKDMQ